MRGRLLCANQRRAFNSASILPLFPVLSTAGKQIYNFLKNVNITDVISSLQVSSFFILCDKVAEMILQGFFTCFCKRKTTFSLKKCEFGRFPSLGQNMKFWSQKNEKKQHKHDKLVFYAYKFISYSWGLLLCRNI